MAETISTVEILESIPEVDISDSVREFAGQNGNYYVRQFKRIQSSKSGYCWTFNLGSAAFGPLWATARGLWGLFWVFSLLEMVFLVMLGLGLWGELGSDNFARAERMQANYETMIGRAQEAREKGDEEDVASLERRAENLAKARDKAIAQGEVARAGGTRLLVIAIVGLVLLKIFEGWIANIAYERLYSRWRGDRTVRSGFNWSIGLLGLIIIAFVYTVTLLRFTTAEPSELITEFPVGNTYYLAIASWIDYWFDLASTNFAFLFKGVSLSIRTILDGVETLLVGTPWPVAMAVIVIFAYRSAGIRVAIFTAAALIYIAVLGYCLLYTSPSPRDS